jgi:hypothetical protein
MPTLCVGGAVRTTEDVRVDSTGARRAPALGGRASGPWIATPAVVVLVTGWLITVDHARRT